MEETPTQSAKTRPRNHNAQSPEEQSEKKRTRNQPEEEEVMPPEATTGDVEVVADSPLDREQDGDADDGESDIDSVAEAGNGNLTDTEDDPSADWDDDLGKNDMEGIDDDASGRFERSRRVLAEALSYAETNEAKVRKGCDAVALYDAVCAHLNPPSNATPREGEEPAAGTVDVSEQRVEKPALADTKFDELNDTEQDNFITFFDERLKGVRDAFPGRWPGIDDSPSLRSEKYQLLKIALACAMFWRPEFWNWLKEKNNLKRFELTPGDFPGLPDTDEKLVEMFIKLHFDEVHLSTKPILPSLSDLVTRLNVTANGKITLFPVTMEKALDEFKRRTNDVSSQGSKALIYEGTFFKTNLRIGQKKLPPEVYRHGVLITRFTSPALYNQLGGSGLKSGVGSSVYRAVHFALGDFQKNKNLSGCPIPVRIFDAKPKKPNNATREQVKEAESKKPNNATREQVKEAESKNPTHPFFAASLTSVLGTDESFVVAENRGSFYKSQQARADLWQAACPEINAMLVSYPISSEVMAQRCMPTFVYHHKGLDERQAPWGEAKKLFEGRRLGGVSALVMSDESGLTNMAKDATELKPTKRDSVQAYNVLRDVLFTKHSIVWKFRRGEAAASVALADVKNACGKAGLQHGVVNVVVQAVEKACAGALKEVTDNSDLDQVLMMVNEAAREAILCDDVKKAVDDIKIRDALSTAVSKKKVDEIIPNACRLHLRSFDEFSSLGKMVVLAQVGSSLAEQRRHIICDPARAFQQHSLDAIFFVVYGEDMANFLAKERISEAAAPERAKEGKTKVTDQDKFRFRAAALCGLVPWKEVAPYISPKCMSVEAYRALKHVRWMSWTLDARKYSNPTEGQKTRFKKLTNALSVAFARFDASGKLPGVLKELDESEEDDEGANVEESDEATTPENVEGKSDIVILAMRTSCQDSLERTNAAQRQLMAMMLSLQRVADETGKKPFKDDAKILLATMVGSKMNVDEIGAMLYYDPDRRTQDMLHKFFNPSSNVEPTPASYEEWKPFYERFAEKVILPAIEKCKTRYTAPENGSENDTIINLGDFARYIPRDAYAKMRDVVTELITSADDKRDEQDVAKRYGIHFVSAFQDRLPFGAEKKLLEKKQRAPVIAFYSPEAAALASIGNRYTTGKDENEEDEDAEEEEEMSIRYVYPFNKTARAMIRLVGAVASVGTAEFALFGALQGVGVLTNETRKKSYLRTSWDVFELIKQDVNADLIPGYLETDVSAAEESTIPDSQPPSPGQGTPDTPSTASERTAGVTGEAQTSIPMSINSQTSSGTKSGPQKDKTAQLEATTWSTKTVRLPTPEKKTTLLAVFRVSRKNTSVTHQELRLLQWLKGKKQVRNGNDQVTGVSFESTNGTEVIITDVIVILLDGVKGTTPVESVAVSEGGVKVLKRNVKDLCEQGLRFDGLFGAREPLKLGPNEWKDYLLAFSGDVFVATVSRIANPGTVGLLVRRATTVEPKRRTFVYDVIMAYEGANENMRQAILHGSCYALNLEVPRVAIWLHCVVFGAELWRYAQGWRMGG